MQRDSRDQETTAPEARACEAHVVSPAGSRGRPAPGRWHDGRGTSTSRRHHGATYGQQNHGSIPPEPSEPNLRSVRRQLAGSRKISLVALLCTALAACDLGTGNSNEGTIAVSPGSLDLDAIGAKDTLTAEVRDGEGRVQTGATVTWSSSNNAVVTISAAGVVTAVANGDANITAASSALSRTIAVRVAQRG